MYAVEKKNSLDLFGFFPPQIINIHIFHRAAREIAMSSEQSRWKRFCLGLAFAAFIIAPVLAQSNASSVSAKVARGIGIYWPYHVILMVAGFILLLAGIIVARRKEVGTWYKNHWFLEAAGSACIIAALLVAIYMVTLSGFPHLINPHEIVGGTVIALVIISVILGLLIKRVKTKTPVRTSHRWIARAAVAIMAINILLGILVLQLVLRIKIF